jgi:hypothetical protein
MPVPKAQGPAQIDHMRAPAAAPLTTCPKAASCEADTTTCALASTT